MSDTSTAEATETAAEDSTEQSKAEYPSDHPLVKALAAQKAELKELRPAAKRLAELEDAQKTETEKAADRIAKAEAEAASVPTKVADALKAHLVTLHGIDQEDAELFLTATEPDLLLKQVTRLLGQSDKRQRKNHVPREGTNTSRHKPDSTREFLHAITGEGQ